MLHGVELCYYKAFRDSIGSLRQSKVGSIPVTIVVINSSCTGLTAMIVTN